MDPIPIPMGSKSVKPAQIISLGSEMLLRFEAGIEKATAMFLHDRDT